MADFSNRVIETKQIPFLSILSLDGQLYDLKDTKARDAITAIETTIANNEQTTSAALNDLQTNKADKSSLATVATSGSYTDLSNTPTLATVATSGSYNDLSDKPDLVNTYVSKTEMNTKFEDVLGVNAEGVAALKALTEDESAATGILKEIGKKVDASSQSTGTVNDHAISYANETLSITTTNKSMIVPAVVTP